jgi:hypothetical protein
VEVDTFVCRSGFCGAQKLMEFNLADVWELFKFIPENYELCNGNN